MFLNAGTFSCCALILLGAACLSPRQDSKPSPEAAEEETQSDEDQKFNERTIKQELGFIRER